MILIQTQAYNTHEKDRHEKVKKLFMHTFNNGQWRVQNLMNNLSFLGNI